MFVDEKKVVSLEYITYTSKSDGRYRRLRKVTHSSKLKAEERNQLGTSDYVADQSKTNPHNAFAEKPIDFEEVDRDYLLEHKKKSREGLGSKEPS